MIHKKIIKKILRRKLLSGICFLVVASGGFYGYQAINGKEGDTQYKTANVSKGTIIQSISGAGAVSSLNQVDIKPKASGDVTWVYVKEGKEVKKGTLLFSIDASDATKSVASADIALATAKLDLEELLSPPDALTLLKAENALADAKSSKQKAEDNLDKAYEDGLNDITNIFFDLPDIMSDLDDILFDSDFGTSQWNIDWYKDAVFNYDDNVSYYRDTAYNNYQKARTNYDANFKNYKDTSRYSDTQTIENLIYETYETTKSIAETVKDMLNLVDFVKDTLTKTDANVPAKISTHQKTLQSYISSTNKLVSSPLAAKRAIEDAKTAIAKADITIQEKELSLEDLKEGAGELTIKSKKLNVQQKEDSLANAKQTLADCYVRAPFDAIIAKLNVLKGESLPSGAAATLMTKQKIAEITLNELDVTKIKTGQKATLQFDAVDNLSITGDVVSVDSLGAVSQGVVSYDVKISFDVDDERIKPGMSVSVSIIIDSKSNVLTVPVSAVKTQGGTNYVEILSDGQLATKQVEAGLASDTMIEIKSGLNEGDAVITQTVTSASQKASASSNSGKNSGFSGGGQMMQIMR